MIITKTYLFPPPLITFMGPHSFMFNKSCGFDVLTIFFGFNNSSRFDVITYLYLDIVVDFDIRACHANNTLSRKHGMPKTWMNTGNCH